MQWSQVHGTRNGLTLGHFFANASGKSDHKPAEVRAGVAIGQIIGGIIATVGGMGGEVLGGATTVTGVGAALGEPGRWARMHIRKFPVNAT